MKALTSEIPALDRLKILHLLEGRGEYFDDFNSFVQKETVYLHKKGGIYRKVIEAQSSDDPTKTVVVYQHLFPHQVGFWVRDKVEFYDEGRFNLLVPDPEETPWMGGRVLSIHEYVDGRILVTAEIGDYDWDFWISSDWLERAKNARMEVG